jgi:predicted nucleic acid-binding protein
VLGWCCGFGLRYSDFEFFNVPSVDEKRLRIKKWQDFANEDVEENQEILKNARRLNSIGLRRMDCLHVACAIYAKCDYFITTDKGILKKSNKIREIIIIDPINFIRELEDVD